MKLKMKELLDEMIQNNVSLDDEIEFYVSMSVGCCGDTEVLSVDDFEIYDYQETQSEKKKTLRINVAPIEGYYSCRQMSKTLKDHKELWDKYNKGK